MSNSSRSWLGRTKADESGEAVQPLMSIEYTSGCSLRGEVCDWYLIHGLGFLTMSWLDYTVSLNLDECSTRSNRIGDATPLGHLLEVSTSLFMFRQLLDEKASRGHDWDGIKGKKLTRRYFDTIVWKLFTWRPRLTAEASHPSWSEPRHQNVIRHRS